MLVSPITYVLKHLKKVADDIDDLLDYIDGTKAL